MNLTSITKPLVLIPFVCLSFLSVHAQDFDEYPQEYQDSVKANVTQRYAIFTVGALLSSNDSNTAYGKGTEPTAGIKLGAQLFFYERFFLGMQFQRFDLDIIDKQGIGNYDESKVTSVYMELGYEFEFGKRLNLGLSIAPLGSASYRNSFSAGNDDRLENQQDTAGILQGKAYLRYNFTRNFSIYASYAYRNDNLRIETATEIQDDFDNVQYQNISFGIKYAIGFRSFLKRPSYLN